MAAVILALGALVTHVVVEKRKSHKAAKQAKVDFEYMQTENGKLYSQNSPSSVYSQTALHHVSESNAPVAMDEPPHYGKMAREVEASH